MNSYQASPTSPEQSRSQDAVVAINQWNQVHTAAPHMKNMLLYRFPMVAMPQQPKQMLSQEVAKVAETAAHTMVVVPPEAQNSQAFAEGSEVIDMAAHRAERTQPVEQPTSEAPVVAQLTEIDFKKMAKPQQLEYTRSELDDIFSNPQKAA